MDDWLKRAKAEADDDVKDKAKETNNTVRYPQISKLFAAGKTISLCNPQVKQLPRSVLPRGCTADSKHQLPRSYQWEAKYTVRAPSVRYVHQGAHHLLREATWGPHTALSRDLLDIRQLIKTDFAHLPWD